MPIYEFMCQNCHKKSSRLILKADSCQLSANFECPFCGSNDLARTVSSFAYHKSLKTIWEESGEPTMHPSDDYYKRPENIGRWAEKKFQEMGEEMPAQLQEEIQAAREGELPEPLKDLKGASPTAAYS
jgi:putative FmdB family regulatory protein